VSEHNIIHFFTNAINDRRFRTTDVPSLVSKGAPPFCTVYIISKGKISSVKTATSPLPVKAVQRALPPPQQLQQSPDRMDVQALMRNHPPRRMIISL
jgi:hypothetical protein